LSIYTYKWYTKNLDGTLSAISYNTSSTRTDTPIANSPPVSFTYDPNFRRLATATVHRNPAQPASDETTIFTYKPITPDPGTLGAGQPDTVDGPLANDTISYGYDVLGRQVSRSVNNIAESVSFDSLGRPSGHTVSALALPSDTFTPAFFNASSLLKSLASPNGQNATFDYFDIQGDQRLKEIWHKDPAGGTLSKFDYQYDVLGRIKQWTQQPGTAAALVEGLEYDAEGQLLNAGIAPANQAGIKGYSYGYDAAGNRTSEQIDTVSPTSVSTVTTSSYNNLNQLTGRSGAGPLPVRFEGTVNKPATVTVNGHAAAVSPDPANPPGGQLFNATLSLQLGWQYVPVTATDFGAGSGNTTTHNYGLGVSGGPARNTISYDYNGNLTSFTTGGAATNYQWDAENRLVTVSSPVCRTEFTYDAFGRRVKIVEKTGSGTITSTKQFVWAGGSICEEREGNNVTKRFFPEGQINYTFTNHTELFYTRDHLGSIREVTDKTGLLRARYDYDPYGRRSPNQVIGANAVEADFGFTGHYFHAPSGLHLARFRAYDSDSGRWLNRDPIGERGGLNLYGYVGNNPISYVDPLGLFVNVENPIVNPGGPMAADILDPQLASQLTPGEVLTPFISYAALAGAVAGIGAVVDAYGASILGWLGLGGAAAESPQGQKACQALQNAMQQRDAALTALNNAEKALADAQTLLENATQAANRAQQSGLNSAVFQQAQQAIGSANTVLAYRAQALATAQMNWQSANAAALSTR
jgi:RHS repeat-associated protein